MTMIIIKISNRNRQNYHDHNHNHDNEDGHCDNDNDHEMIIIFVMINIEHMCSKKKQHPPVSSIDVCLHCNEELDARCLSSQSCHMNRSRLSPAATCVRTPPPRSHTNNKILLSPNLSLVKLIMIWSPWSFSSSSTQRLRQRQHSLLLNIDVYPLRNEKFDAQIMSF